MVPFHQFLCECEDSVQNLDSLQNFNNLNVSKSNANAVVPNVSNNRDRNSVGPSQKRNSVRSSQKTTSKLNSSKSPKKIKVHRRASSYSV